MQLPLRIGARTETEPPIEIAAFDENGVTLSFNDELIDLQFEDADDKIAVLADDYVIQGGYPFEEADGSTSYFVRYAPVVFGEFICEPGETELELVLEQWYEVDYSERLALRVLEFEPDGVTLQVLDPFANAEQPLIVRLGADDEEEGIVRVITHASKQYALQGQGVEDDVFRFRVAEFYFQPDDQDKPCPLCK